MIITSQELGAERWGEYFDSLAPSIEGMLVTIELIGEQIGDQIEVERLPLQTIGYDHHDNVLEIAVGGRGPRFPVLLRHFIFTPRTISIEESGRSTPSAILVTDDSDTRTLIRLYEPAILEP